MAHRILVVGAGGFIGGFIAQRGIDRGYETWVAVRSTTSRRYLTDSNLKFLTLDYDDPEGLRSALESALPMVNGGITSSTTSVPPSVPILPTSTVSITDISRISWVL